MGILCNFWSLIKKIILTWIVRLFYVPSNFSTSKKNKRGNDDELPEGLQQELMPQHVAVILDGNRRWAKQRGLSYVEGYEAGLGCLGAMEKFVTLCCKWKIPVVSLFLFSTENWLRPKEQIDFLLELYEKVLMDNKETSISHRARISVVGDTSLFPISLQEAIKRVEEATKDRTGFHLILSMSYSGQYDIVQACKSIATKVKNGVLEPEDVTKSLIDQELVTKVISIPNPDLLIRTSGELRISNYYLWQSAYTELYFTDIYWPDFGEEDFVKALRSYQQRGRRFGRK